MRDLSNENIIHVKKNELEYIQFKKLLEYKNIEHCFTLKPLNFAGNATYEEKREEVEKSLKLLSEELEFSVKDICRPKQTHTDKVEKIENGDEGIYLEKFDNVDGLVTDQKNKVLMLGFADCTPLLFYDPVKKIIANTHSGWKGLAKYWRKNSRKNAKRIWILTRKYYMLYWTTYKEMPL